MTTATATTMPETRVRAKLCVAAIIVSAAIGAWASASLLIDHDGGWSVGETRIISGLCDTPNRPGGLCRDAVAGRFGSFDFFIGSRRVLIPTSLVGLSYFVAVGVWFAMLGGIPRGTRWLWCMTLTGLACGLIASVILVGVMMLTLPHECPFCLIAHACNGLIVAAAVALWRTGRGAAAVGDEISPMAHVARGYSRRRLAFWALAGSVTAAVGFWLQFDTTVQVRRQWRKLSELRDVVGSLQADPGFVMREFMAQPVVEIPPLRQTGVRLVSDASSAAVQLVIFVDYDVSACACFAGRREAFIDAAFPDGLDVVYRFAPALGGAGSIASIGSDDELAVRRVSASLACRAAAAARLQGGAAAFERMHRLLLRTRRDGPGRDYDALARAAGLDVERFRIDMNGEVVRRRVRDDLALARRLGVQAVPAAFLEGRRVPDLCLSSAVFWNAIGQDYAGGVAWTSAADKAVR